MRPAGNVIKIIDSRSLCNLSSTASGSARRRANWNLHPVLDDPIQRFCNAMEPGTYVRPHRHAGEGRWELFLALTGSAIIVTFDGGGLLKERVFIDAKGPNFGLEIPGDTWHTVAAAKAGTVLFELKPGPYVPLTDKDFAPWAPAEGASTCAAFEVWFRDGEEGSAPPLDP